ncbi:tRNA (N6-threonylcarbamoyladenosine(37)-N6)-methyltransferase TrmO [Alteromonas sp. 1_MG-2023]|uniref:tRNA (N6-threonylcarbamoyladenosine(37)-N6)-methyltransferase TrmO n=1 Tax=Alteromonas sp. 1_MG-2023 TaxID=3062669 RepID=UPI0026E13F46|nr:tRNA (N6-threonylcarbamoyladenosine(37)-N6)-methyltransferase TrmO [Alteromonas sp. 1_MG-2023]MDO6566231.1 tRNA (N6-threonylcarbamoyladenosine(37)-N6)-methyltransferase TrmO [Alteromonas sp. 1_MG-2023]
MTLDQFPLCAIGHIQTPFKQKFAIPRQPNLAKAKGQIVLAPDFDDPRVFKGLEVFSHVWLLFLFHENLDKGWKPSVKAPRLGGNATLGVFASRSTHRPNGIGMSAVKNLGSETVDGKLTLNVEGVDLLDGTPIIDIKPYLPYADALPHASDSMAELTHAAPIPNLDVTINPLVQDLLQEAAAQHPDLPTLLTAVLAQDPRPAYRHKLLSDEKTYHTTLYNYDFAFTVKNGVVDVVGINAL